VGELAVGAVDLTPLLEQPDDLRDLPVQQAMHRAATGGLVGQLASGTPVKPPVDAQLTDLHTRQTARTVQPCPVACSSKSSSPALVAASTLGGTWPLSPNALFPPPASA
jgi:hypothetical protein